MLGHFVYSKSGHDKGKLFVVIQVVDDYVYLVDGKSRTLDKPKKKKLKHIQPTKYKCEFMTDSDIRRYIKEYRESE